MDSEIFISAGEVSGDLHGGNLLQALHDLRPGLRAFGIGGPRLAASGQEQLAGIERLSLMGLTEVVPRLASILRLLGDLKAELARRRPAAVILIDSPDFNFRLAAHARRLGLKVIYYISPQLWAWRRGRVRAVRRDVDLMICILPFEEPFYREHGVRAVYVGHPLVDTVRPALPRAEFLRRQGLDPARPVIALLPGSRRTEVRALSAPLLGAARLLARRSPAPQFLVPAASPQVRELLAPFAAQVPEAQILDGQAYDCLAAAQAAVVASGTATLETALLGTPFVLVYRLSRLSYLAARALIRVPYAGMPNLLLGEEAAPELLQERCRPELIAGAVARFLDESEAAFRLREKFARLKDELGSGGASRRAASAVARELGWEDAP